MQTFIFIHCFHEFMNHSQKDYDFKREGIQDENNNGTLSCLLEMTSGVLTIIKTHGDGPGQILREPKTSLVR